ncbi:MAG: polysaccharide pyruvyl transferase family protein [Nanoarchaeota archaeon]|nr:polysaccharide pyruvyl transferase family protein [Nanoarchaeota archaeon]
MVSKNKIALFDPSINTGNLGDKIIIESVNKTLKEIFRNASKVGFSTRERLNEIDLKQLKNSDIQIVGGTNLLSSHMLFYKQWKIGLKESKSLSNCILLGVGWWQYQTSPDFYTKLILRRLLSKTYIHAVRDNYTKDKLKKIGINNSFLTGCPTIWTLTKKHCKKIPFKKSKNVIFTLTDYKKDKKLDKTMIEILSKKYDKLYFWPQGKKDTEYLKRINKKLKIKLTILPRSIKALDTILKKGDIDYIGTRLHAGIRALQHKRRTIIISIDNRAEEMGKDFNLPTINRNDLNYLSNLIDKQFKINIKLPLKEIKTWKSQFKKLK